MGCGRSVPVVEVPKAAHPLRAAAQPEAVDGIRGPRCTGARPKAKALGRPKAEDAAGPAKRGAAKALPRPKALSRKLRVLSLHGITSNARAQAHFCDRFVADHPGLEDYLEFVHAEAPHLCTDHAEGRWRSNDPNKHTWDLGRTIGQAGKVKETKRAVAALQETMSYLQKFVKNHGPFDGILGHSQGGIWLLNVLDAKEYGSAEERESFACLKFGIHMMSTIMYGNLWHSHGSSPSLLKYAMGWTGKLGNPDIPALQAQKLRTPLWQFVGRKDSVVPVALSRKIRSYCSDAQLTEDPAGDHNRVRMPDEDLAKFKAWLRAFG